MRPKLLLFAGALMLCASPAFATPITLTGSYSVSEQYSPYEGGPSISNDLREYRGSFDISPLTLGTETSPTSFFTASPQYECSGNGCSGGHAGTETDTLTINFSSLAINGLAGVSLTDTALLEDATFTAAYSGSELPCAVGDGNSYSASGQSDCVIWNGASDTWDGSTILTDDLSNGDVLDIYLYNASDWDITPTIGFELQDPQSNVPEPGSLSLLVAGIAGLAGFELIRRRRGPAC